MFKSRQFMCFHNWHPMQTSYSPPLPPSSFPSFHTLVLVLINGCFSNTDPEWWFGDLGLNTPSLIGVHAFLKEEWDLKNKGSFPKECWSMTFCKSPQGGASLSKNMYRVPWSVSLTSSDCMPSWSLLISAANGSENKHSPLGTQEPLKGSAPGC